MAPVPLPTHQFPSNFIDFSSIFRFSRTHMPDLVITTHLGLPSSSTIDWPNIPPTCWPQCHSLLHSPSFLSIFIDITSNLPICLSNTYLPTYPPTPSGLHPRSEERSIHISLPRPGAHSLTSLPRPHPSSSLPLATPL